MTISHKDLAGSDLHEPKGIAAATDGEVYVADGDDSGNWRKLTADNLTGTGNPFGGQLFQVQDEKVSGTVAGAFDNGSWVKRTLNTTKTNEISGASLSNSVITLPTGTYHVRARAPATRAGLHKLRFFNNTANASVLHGASQRCDFEVTGGDGSMSTTTDATLEGRFTITGNKNFQLEHRCDGADARLGWPCDFSATEIYAQVFIWKVG